jgi:hypothetical protein
MFNHDVSTRKEKIRKAIPYPAKSMKKPETRNPKPTVETRSWIPESPEKGRPYPEKRQPVSSQSQQSKASPLETRVVVGFQPVI